MTFEDTHEDRHEWCADQDCPICLERWHAQVAALIDDDRDEEIQQQYRMC